MTGFQHEAVLYPGGDGYVDAVVPYLRDGLDAGDEVLVVVPEAQTTLLRDALGEDAERMAFLDMAAVGRNPGRIISAWHDAAAAARRAGRPLRGLGEPVWAGRSAAELDECQRHECLLNTAFADTDALSILCPYDADALPADVLDGVWRSHPAVDDHGVWQASDAYRGPPEAPSPFRGDLTPAPGHASALGFTVDGLPAVRALATERARDAGLPAARVDDLVTAMSELAANSVCHGGGTGTAWMWDELDAVVGEVADAGRLIDPLAGRIRAPLDQPRGRGLWLAHQLCDLVQVRSGAHGTRVRVTVHAG